MRLALAAVAAVLLLAAPAAGRIIRAETVPPPGQSGFVPQQGDNPHLADQVSLFESAARGGRGAAQLLSRRFGSDDPAAWREPRRMYDVQVVGLAPKPALRFYDRGTWQQAVELGP
ncbi:MAG: hypothetical protein ACRDPC_21755 [Solirubrobacteraceae bacterium]